VISTRTVILALVLAGVAGCASTPKPTPAKAALVAAADVNPDIEGHPAPIVVRIYELKEEGAFKNADYFKLIDREQEALGTSLVAREEYELQPGESRTWELKISPEVHFLAAAAGYRDLANSSWKAVLPAPRKRRQVTIDVGKSVVSIMVNK
jgi:type VI secretion system protein VasD